MISSEREAGSLRSLNIYAIVAVVTLAANILIIANPGFQSHDEWQIYDFVQKYGLEFFVRAYVRVRAGPEFGFPVRPLGFLQEGLLSAWMPSAPVVLHGFSVALQMVTAVVFTRVLLRAGLHRHRAIAAGLLFGASPLAAFATGWTAACFDQWYSLFAIVAAWVVVVIVDRGFSAGRVIALAAASALAVLSKETAMMLPAAAGSLAVALGPLRGSTVLWRRAILIGVVSAAPVLCYLAIRFPAIVATVHLTGGPYTPSLRNAPGNALMYFAYPALAFTDEIPTFALARDWPVLAATGIHLLLILGVLRRFGWFAAGAYLAAYFIFLLPVVTLPGPGSHYLYASGFVTSLALGCLLVDAAGRVRPRFPALAAAAGAALLTVHSIDIQRVLYDNGRCQHDFLLSLDTRMSLSPGPLVIRADPGVRWWNGVRAVTGREAYARVTVIDPASTRHADDTMDWSCRVSPAAP